MRALKHPRLAATAGYLALAVTDSYLAGRPGPAARRVRYVSKPLLMPTLATATHLAAGDGAAGLVRGVQAAQAFSWGGDVALLGRGRTSFLSGVGSFLLAHVAYIGGFLTAKDPDAGLTSPGAKAGAGAWAATAPVLALAAGRQDPTLRGPIATYAGVLSAMFATSTMLKRSMPARARRQVLAGSALFLLSDSLLGTGKFLLEEPHPALESAVMATYTGGQWLIAEGAAAASRS